MSGNDEAVTSQKNAGDAAQVAGYLMHVDYFDGHCLKGWAKSNTSADPLTCRVLIDGNLVLTELKANLYREDLFTKGIGNGNFGFDIMLPKRHVGIEECVIALVDIRKDELVGETTVQPKRFRGNIDTARDKIISGWCYMCGTEQIRKIDLLVDGTETIIGASAELPRHDVHMTFNENLYCGYEVTLPSSAELQHDSVIVLRDSETGLEISRIKVGDLAPHFAPTRIASTGPKASDGGALGKDIAVENQEFFDHAMFLVPEDREALFLGERRYKSAHVKIYALEGERRVAVYVTTPNRQPPSRLRKVTVTVDKTVQKLEMFRLPVGEETETADLTVYRGSLPCLFGEGTAPVTVQWGTTAIYSGDLKLGASFEGRIERFADGTLHGWAIDFTHPGEAAELKMAFSGIFYDVKKTDVRRSDVLNLYPSFPINGFRLEFNPHDLGHTSLVPTIHVGEADEPLRSKMERISLTRPKADLPASAKAAAQILLMPSPVSVIIPVYNAFEDLGTCIESVMEHTELSETGHNLILVNDASSDERIVPFLDSYAHLPFVTIFHQSKNVGYTANVNTGIRLATEIALDRDVVLLNSDTQVTPQWLSLLQRAARQRPSIGSVTAVSDNAGAFSVPKQNTANPLPPWLERDDLARQITHISQLQHFRTPTGSGFCLYIASNMFRDIGLFDEKNFPRGYGEENDFCMRGLHAGWEHVIADNVLIYHERSKSFLGQKTELMDKANDLIPEMYPEYSKAVGKAIFANAGLKAMRHRIGTTRLRADHIALPRVAFVIGVESGGTPQTNMDLMSSIQDEYEPWLLLCSTGKLTIFRISGKKRTQVEIIMLEQAVEAISHDSPAYRAAIADVLQRYAFELVHIRHIGRHGLSLISTARALEIPVIFSLHDFYTVCPNVKLLDAENRYCGGICTEGGDDCNVELWDHATVPKLKHGWIKSWQKVMARVLNDCDQLITTSPFTRDLIRSRYGLEDTPFDVIPHARDFPQMERLGRVPVNGEPLRIFMPGHLVSAKGLDLVKAIKSLDIHDQLEFHFAGISHEDLSPYGVEHGRYKREEISDLIRKINPHIGAVLAIWPETYSHTVTEMWAAGLPIITTQLGATGERVAKHGGGWALEDMSPESVYKKLSSLINEAEEINFRTAEVFRWQIGYGRTYSLQIMAERYKRVYRRVMAARKSGSMAAEAFLVTVGRKHSKATIGTAHLTQVLERQLGRHHLSHWPESYLSLIDEMARPDALVIRYHGPVPYLRELGDLLIKLEDLKVILDIAPDCPPSAWHVETRTPDLELLLESADEVVAPHVFTDDPLDEMNIAPAFRDSTALATHLERMKERAEPAIPALPRVTATTHETSAARLENEVQLRASTFIAAHNALLVDANFSLIDWRRMLTQPRIKGMVSIVVPVYNRVEITLNMVQSILRNTTEGRVFEIIVVDNGSVLEAHRQLRTLHQMDSRVHLVRTDAPLMFSVGCNYGASFARGEYVLFMNNDMLVRNKDWLTQLVQPLETQPCTGIVGARLLYEDLTVQHAGIAFNDASKFPYHIYKGMPGTSPCVMKARDMTAVTGACMAMKASDWAKLRGFSPLYVNGSEDIDLCLRMKTVLGKTVHYVAGPEIIHLEGKSPGRGQANVHNRTVFLGLWGGSILSDDQGFYTQDGMEMPTFHSNDVHLNPEFQSIVPTVEYRNHTEV